VTQLSKLKIPQPSVKFQDETIEGAFPKVDPGVIPYGSRVLVQLKQAASKTEGGIIIGDGATQTEFDNTKVARVVAVGPVAFRNRETLDLWPEKEWCTPGTFVRIPLHTNTQNAWTVPYKDGRVGFALIDDLQLLGEQPDPFYIKAWL
jgi:3D (Asp-Asp-Asp) domain-containing protein